MKIIGSNRWGCGIHSPYIYTLISRVIYGNEFRSPLPPDTRKTSDRNVKRFLDITGRLIRFFKPGMIVITGQKEETNYLIAQICPDTPVIHTGEVNAYVPETNHEFVIWNEIPESIPEIPGPLYKSLWIFRKGHVHRMNFLMNELRFSEKVSVTLNLKHTAIVIFNQDLQKENFVIRRFI
jgi:hypothetical protein